MGHAYIVVLCTYASVHLATRSPLGHLKFESVVFPKSEFAQLSASHQVTALAFDWLHMDIRLVANYATAQGFGLKRLCRGLDSRQREPRCAHQVSKWPRESDIC